MNADVQTSGLTAIVLVAFFFSHSKSYSKKEIEGEEKYDLGEKAPREEI